ncbi:MAG: P-loop NTPase [Nitrospinota bacterium]
MPNIYAIAGGKGGIGKSVVSILLAQAFSFDGKSTVLVDADLGGANLHTLLGINYPRATLIDFLTKRVKSINDVLLLTKDKNIRMISGAGEVLGTANLKWSVRQKLVRNMKTLSADNVIMDLGAGSSFNVIDFFLAVENHIMVVSPEPTALQNAYMFLKACIQRLLYLKFYKYVSIKKQLNRFMFPGNKNAITTVHELIERVEPRSAKLSLAIGKAVNNFRPHLIVNLVDDQSESLKYHSAIKTTAKKYLNVEIQFLGTVYRNPQVMQIIKSNKSLLEIKPGVNNYPLTKIKSALYKELIAY